MRLSLRQINCNIDLEDIKSVSIPGENGFFDILENHSQLVSLLRNGNIEYVDKHDEKHIIEIENSGIVFVKNNIVNIVLV